jgi:acyl carrier protein
MDKENLLLKWVKESLIFERLNLADTGLRIEDVGDTTPLFNADGLDLDSVDGLELAVGIEQKFGIKIGPLNEALARNKFANALSIRDYILELQKTLHAA